VSLGEAANRLLDSLCSVMLARGECFACGGKVGEAHVSTCFVGIYASDLQDWLRREGFRV
jgi:hypothetical protein